MVDFIDIKQAAISSLLVKKTYLDGKRMCDIAMYMYRNIEPDTTLQGIIDLYDSIDCCPECGAQLDGMGRPLCNCGKDLN